MDGDFIQWIKDNYEDTDNILSVEEKSFTFKYSNELFNDPIKLKETLEFDREFLRFNQNKESAYLCELSIPFGPTYCLDGKNSNSSKRIYSNKRIPAWCDRITFTTSSHNLLVSQLKSVIFLQLFL